AARANIPRPETLPVANPLASRMPLTFLTAGMCALAAGCLSELGVPTTSKPSGPGYLADFEPHAFRIEMRPRLCNSPVGGTQVFIATVYDEAGVPRRHRRVEWMIEGPGGIIEVDDNGDSRDRGVKLDNKSAFSFTDYFEHRLTRGSDD